MTPEATVLIINAVFMAYAYLWAYPAIVRKTISAIMLRDTAISLAALLVAGMLYWDTGVRFSLILFDTNWAVFSIIILIIFETPLSFWFVRKYDIDI